ncbi:MAG TPA: YggT family protein [Solirubrobacteraceae bacterium]|nr:YggT family protein [Solirubrobacteraceae bacterium]
MIAVLVLLANVRGQIADYLSALLQVYSLLIVAYVVTSFIFAMGVRVPYSRWSDAILKFLRDVSEPYLRIFRRFIPAIGALDFSPIVALLVLYLLGSLLVALVRG